MKLLTEDEVIKKLRLDKVSDDPVRTLNHFRKRKGLKSTWVRTGRVWVESEVEAWMAENFGGGKK